MIERTGHVLRVFLSGLAVATAAAAESSQEPPAAAFAEQVEVRVVEIDVAVRDREGRHVAGLRAEDFRLTVDGLETAIDFFSEQRGGSGAGPARAAGSGGVESTGRSSDATPLHLLVYVDEEFSLPTDLERVLRGLEEQLDRLEDRDRVAIVAWDGRRLDRILDWTPPGPELARALAEARRRPAWGLRSRVDLGGWRAPVPRLTGDGPELAADPSWLRAGAADEPCAAAGEPDDPTCASRARQRSDVDSRLLVHEVRNRLERAARAAAAAVRSVARPPGRRALVLLSGGWPLSAGVPFGAASHPFSWTDAPALRLLDPLLDVADQLGYTIYPVDVPGMLASFGADVERAAPGIRGPDFASGPSIPNLSEAPYHDTLRYLAQRTGGVAFLNGRRRVALDAIAADARDFYSLAFTAPRERDDRTHRIRVEVAGAGVSVRTRSAYRDSSDAAELEYQVEAALLEGGAGSDSLLVATAGKPERDGAFRMRLPLRVEVPRAVLSGGPAGAQSVPLVVELRVAAVDGAGRRTFVGPVPIALAAIAGDPTRVAAQVPLRLRRTEQELAVSLHARGSGRHLIAGLSVAP